MQYLTIFKVNYSILFHFIPLCYSVTLLLCHLTFKIFLRHALRVTKKYKV
jgi:hypothetical protein